MALLVACASGNKSFACVAFTANFLLINASVPASRRGAVNGLAMTIGGLAKALGPMGGATLYAWSITNGARSPPLNFMLVFLLCFLLGLGTCLLRLDPIPPPSQGEGQGHPPSADQAPAAATAIATAGAEGREGGGLLYSLQAALAALKRSSGAGGGGIQMKVMYSELDGTDHGPASEEQHQQEGEDDDEEVY